jgi:C1A family cysteine protease
MSLWHATQEEIDSAPYKVSGIKPSPRSHEDWIYGNKINMATNELPRRVWREKREIYNQGQEGACTGFGGTYHKSVQEAPSHNGELLNFSKRFLYNMARKIDGLDDKNEGSTPLAIMQVLQKYGVCLESTLPYLANQIVTITNVQLNEAKQFRIKNYAKITSLEEMKHAISLGKTILSGVMVTDTFMHSENGFIGQPEGAIYGGHCIDIEDYDDDLEYTFKNGKKSKGFFRFPNSWGKEWGDDGYGYLSYDFIKLRSDMGFYWYMEGWTSIDLDSDPVPPKSTDIIELWIDNNEARINGNKVQLLAPPTIFNDITLVPLRFIGEALGCKVEWDGEQRKIIITK